jgi:hypothetical protein
MAYGLTSFQRNCHHGEDAHGEQHVLEMARKLFAL